MTQLALKETQRRTRPDNANDPNLKAKLEKLQRQLDGLRRLAS